MSYFEKGLNDRKIITDYLTKQNKKPTYTILSYNFFLNKCSTKFKIFARSLTVVTLKHSTVTSLKPVTVWISKAFGRHIKYLSMGNKGNKNRKATETLRGQNIPSLFTKSSGW